MNQSINHQNNNNNNNKILLKDEMKWKKNKF